MDFLFIFYLNRRKSVSQGMEQWRMQWISLHASREQK